MICALIFDCFGVLVIDSAIGLHRDEAALQFAKAQRSRYRTALLSNISRRGLEDHFTHDELTGYFDAAIAAHDEAAAKPQAAAFLLAVERLGVRPEEAVMIDDTEGHCVGARAAGLRAIHYRSLAQLQSELSALTDAE